MGSCPGAESRLYLWIQPLLGRDPTFENPEVEAPQGSRALERRQLLEWKTRSVLAQWDEQRTARIWCKGVCAFEQVDPVDQRQVEVGGDQGDLVASPGQLLECVKCGFS